MFIRRVYTTCKTVSADFECTFLALHGKGVAKLGVVADTARAIVMGESSSTEQGDLITYAGPCLA